MFTGLETVITGAMLTRVLVSLVVTNKAGTAYLIQITHSSFAISEAVGCQLVLL